jgi:acetyl-CoA acyltransferase
VPGSTVNRLCGSGGEAILSGARALATGDADLIVAGGVESMSRAPYVLPKPDEALPRDMRMFHTQVGWRMTNPQFPEEWTRPLGACAEEVAAELGIGRAAQDEWALRSHRLADAAWQAGKHDGWVVPVEGVKRDESIRPHTSLEQLAALRPAFSSTGTVTAGNASPINDGAVAVLLATAAMVGELRAEPIGEIVASATVGIEPHRFTLGPVGAIAKALRRARLETGDIALWEINEAFAAMVLSCLHELPPIDRDLVNPNGGAIALGHPLGASVPRVLVELCRELARRGGGYGVAAACVGVGQGVAIVVKV